MEFLFDWAGLDDIRKYYEIYPITGITSNPSIIKKIGKIDFFSHFKEIRSIIGIDKSLHIQVTARDADVMIQEAHTLCQKIDDQVYVKIPVTEEGLKAMRVLKAEGVNITATAIYTKIQGFLALEAGADFIAPYYNRMEQMDIDAAKTIGALAGQIERYHYKTKILAASFKNVGQINKAFEAGAQTATVPPELLHDVLGMAAIGKTVGDFENDWKEIFGSLNITEL